MKAKNLIAIAAGLLLLAPLIAAVGINNKEPFAGCFAGLMFVFASMAVGFLADRAMEREDTRQYKGNLRGA